MWGTMRVPTMVTPVRDSEDNTLLGLFLVKKVIPVLHTVVMTMMMQAMRIVVARNLFSKE